MATRLTRLLLITLILSLGFGQLFRFELFGLPIFLHDILILAILAINMPAQAGLQGRTLKVSLRNSTGLKLILLGLVIGAVRALTLFPIPDLLIPALYSLRLIAYLMLYIVLNSHKLKLHKQYFLLAGLISLTIGLAQYFLMPDMRIFQYLGWDDHLSRLTLPHFDPTFSAAMLVIYLLFSLQPAISLYTISLSTTILLTYSRSIWLSLALTAFSFAKRKASTLFAICSLLFVLYVALPRQFGEGTNLLRTYSISSRWDHDIVLAKRVGFNFVIGTGYNTLPLLLNHSDPTTPNHATSFNNSFLTILATSGVIGLTGWIIFLHSLYTNHQSLRPILTFLIIGSFFNNLLLYPFTLLLLLLLTVPTSN